jgi:hypothetical protein
MNGQRSKENFCRLWKERFATVKCIGSPKAAEPVLMQAGKDVHPQKNLEQAQAMILEDGGVNIAQIIERLDLTFASPWFKPQV